MTTSYTPLLGLALPATGELSGTWGATVNSYITEYLDAAIAGVQTISGTQTAVTLSVANGVSLVQAGATATGSAQYRIINCTGTPASLLTITAPAASRVYVVINATAQSVKLVGAGPTTGVTMVAGEEAICSWNGTDFVKVASTVLTALTGTLGTANGGTGLTAGTSGGVLYYSATNTLASSAALAASAIVLGGGAGATPATTTTGTGVVTALGVNTGSAGAFVVNGGALGTPSSGNLSSCTTDGTNGVGYINIPQNAQTGSYTLVAGDAGKHIYHAALAAAATYTIPANASVAYAIGTAVTFINMSTNNVTVAITTDTLYLGGTGTTGSRTLAQYGVATCVKMTSTTWVITGSGLT
jgi:hypothetical protein